MYFVLAFTNMIIFSFSIVDCYTKKIFIMQKKRNLKKAMVVLDSQLHLIDRVSEWAEASGFSNTKTFSRLFRNHFGERPAVVMKRKKLEKAIELLSNGNELSNYEIARAIGKVDEQALYHFVNGKTGNPPEFYKGKK